MAPSSKRKRTAPSNSQHKRLKYSESSSPAQPIDSQEDYWLAECICDEKVDRGTRKYLVQWQGRDPATGKAWAPTWEPRAHCSKPLLASWEIEKTIKEREHRRGKGGQSHKKARASTLPSKSRSTALGSEPTTPAHDSAVLHGSASSSSATIQAETAASPFTPHASPRIPIKQRGSSFDAAEYEPYSESASSQSQSQSAQSHTQQTDLASSQLFAESARPKPLSSGIVQDSQDSAGEATFLPTTQHHSSQSSTTATTESPEEQVEDDVTEDSGLLDITENLLSRHPSRARSIAETIPETVADSQSQLPQFITPEIAETPSVTQTPTELSDIVLRQVSNRYGSSNIEEQTRLPSQQGPAHGFIQVLETPPEYEQLYPPRVQRFRRVREEIPLTSSQVCPASPQPAIGHIPATSNEKSLSEDTTQFQSAPQVPLHIQAVISALSARTHPASQHTCTETRVSSTIPPRQDFTSRTAKRQHHRPEHTTFSGVSRVSDQQEIGPAIPEASSRRVADSLLGRASACESQQFRSSRESIRSQEQCAQIVPSDFGLDTPAENTPSIQEPVDPEQKKRDLDSFRAEHPHLVFPAGNLSTQEETPPTILETVEQVYGSGEQCAQIVPRGAELSTQEHATSSTRGTEGQKHRKRGISKSRHDSSQESPKPTGSSGHTSSPIRYPPNYSLPSGASSLPPRPATPATISLRSIMSSDKIVSVHVASELGTEIDMHCTQKPFTPSRRVIGRGSNANLANNSEDSPAASGSARRLLGANASPLLAHPGTRSPSAIPDHAPESIAPKSLCAVVTVPPPPPPPPLVTDKTVIEKPTQNTVFEKPTRHTVFEKPKPKEVTELPTTGANIQVLETQEERETPPESAQAATEPNNNDELSDADDEENGSLVHDDLQLEDEEHIVPIYIEGRQLDMYRAYVKQHQTVLEQFLVDRQNFKELSKVKEILAHLRGIETHIDLVFAEADSSSFENTATQIGHAARFGRENSVKFRFLQSFFHSLREHKKHVLLVTEHDDEAFFRIIETFCKAEYINYNMPTYGRQADPSAVEGAMSVTIIPSTTSPIVNPPDVIICLDGVQTASRIRLRNWAQARSPIHQVVPVLHLVIPQTVSAIERFIAPSLSHRDQLHATIAILAQMYRSGTLGKPVDGGPVPRASSYGPVVVDWMIESHGGSAWLLPALDRIKDVTEYQSQISPEIQASTTPPAIGRYKRRLDDVDFDPSKRMRLTPQPYASGSTSAHDNETTLVSDSMPATATNLGYEVDDSTLRQQLARAEEALSQERAARKIDQQKLEMWERQLTEHENLRQEHRTLLNHNRATEAKLETVTKNLGVTRELLQARTTELNEKTRELEDQRATDVLSTDEKTKEITRLRQELAAARDERACALKDAASANDMLEYVKEARRVAEDALVATRSTITALTTENENLAHQASGQPTKLKAIHYGRQTENLTKQNKALRTETTILKKTLSQKEEDLARARTGRMGVGTRGTSVTPQPKTRSRAGSPMGGRVSNLRKE